MYDIIRLEVPRFDLWCLAATFFFLSLFKLFFFPLVFQYVHRAYAPSLVVEWLSFTRKIRVRFSLGCERVSNLPIQKKKKCT